MYYPMIPDCSIPAMSAAQADMALTLADALLSDMDAAATGIAVLEHQSLSSRLAFGRRFIAAVRRQQATEQVAAIVREFSHG